MKPPVLSVNILVNEDLHICQLSRNRKDPMNPAKHAVVKTEGGHRVMVRLVESQNGIAHYAFVDQRAFPTAMGADAEAALLEDLALTPISREKECA